MDTGHRKGILIAIAMGWSTICNLHQLQAQGLAPEETVKRMQVADGFQLMWSPASHWCGSRSASSSTIEADCG